jgi:hypothetical protein
MIVHIEECQRIPVPQPIIQRLRDETTVSG